MKVLSIKKISEELGLEREIIEKEICSIIRSFRDKAHRFILGKGEEAKVIVVYDADIGFIERNAKRGPAFLASHFGLNLETFLSILDELKLRGAIMEETYNKLMEAIETPATKVSLDPAEVIVGETTSLCVEILPPTTIENLKLSLSLPDNIEIVYEPKIPEKLLPSKIPAIEKYVLKAKKHGKYKIGVSLQGLIDGWMYSAEVGEVTLKVKPLPPEVEVDLTTPQELSAILNREFKIIFKIRNTGRGDAKNLRIVGISDYREFDVLSGETVGSLASGAILMHILRLIPKKSGMYKLDKLILSFEDVEGIQFMKVIPPITVNVEVLQPKLKIELIPPGRVKTGEIFPLIVKITNIGEGSAKNIEIDLPISPELIYSGQSSFRINILEARASYERELFLKAPNKELKIDDFVVKFQDEEGKELTEHCSGILIPVREEKFPIPIVEKPWPFIVGATIKGKYRLIEMIGEGGYAKVYLAEHLLLRRKVALKALKPEFTRDPIKREHFISEARKCIDLRDKNIVAVFDVDVEEFEGEVYPFIVMEYVDGGALSEKLEPGRPLDFQEALSVLSDISEALHAASLNGIVHCDVKPSNIFYDKKNNMWKLGDFGLSSIIQGTPSYMAPEIKGGREPTTKSDVYSLGVVAREILTGRTKGNLQSIKNLYKDIDEKFLNDIIEFVERMTSPDPDQRPTPLEVVRFMRKTWQLAGETYKP
jgi:tRNA A-37 threonylcarbamoyl transferase component Bud32